MEGISFSLDFFFIWIDVFSFSKDGGNTIEDGEGDPKIRSIMENLASKENIPFPESNNR